MMRLLACAAVLMLLPLTAAAEDPLPSTTRYEKARVIEASQPITEIIAGTDVEHERQTITVELTEGPDEGQRATFENDYLQVERGDVVYVRHVIDEELGIETGYIAELYRMPVLVSLALAFLVLLIVFGGLQGVRGLASLAGSLLLIFYVLLPGIYGGLSPILLSILVASLITVFGSYVTHGFTRTTTAAMLGMVSTVAVTGVAAYLAIDLANLSGFTSEQNVYLNFNTSGRIDMVGLLFGGVMIGLLGVLYDMAIGQAVAIEELYRAGAHYTRLDAYRRGLRIGREHIGALVNTLAIAYVGASLPLFLLFTQAANGMEYLANSELFATEIIRILIGSSGLVLAVPITTLIAAWMLYGRVSGSAPLDRHAHAHNL
ncbi:MAG: YibE/F family protein [Candidatus Pacebacteria bacterium]|nr:YibE/F family protein [Candidatus Paceibacterota bacterium]MBP9840053.1 YibE/F family protein [Candidatus Paceibacterota bacterium]